jgi:hypothetical protein
VGDSTSDSGQRRHPAARTSPPPTSGADMCRACEQTMVGVSAEPPRIVRFPVRLAAPSRMIGWKGLNFCEVLAAAFTYVVGYYPHGDGVSEAAKILQKDISLREMDAKAAAGEGSAAVLQPGGKHRIRLGNVLIPHFRYGLSLDIHAPKLMRPEPGLVAIQPLRDLRQPKREPLPVDARRGQWFPAVSTSVACLSRRTSFELSSQKRRQAAPPTYLWKPCTSDIH